MALMIAARFCSGPGEARRGVPVKPSPMGLLLRFPLLLPALLWLLACSPDTGFNTIDDYDAVSTHYLPEEDFSTILTFALPDTVIHYMQPDSGSEQEIPRDFDGLMLGLVRTNLEALGYVEETDPAHVRPDVYVIVTAATADWKEDDGYSKWVCWEWCPCWPAAWGPNWTTYYRYPAQYFYFAGTVFIDMIDDDQADVENQRIPLVWAAAINGLLSDTTEDKEAEITTSIDQAFSQSPYLGTGREPGR